MDSGNSLGGGGGEPEVVEEEMAEGDESCILIENEVSTIEIDDSVVDGILEADSSNAAEVLSDHPPLSSEAGNEVSQNNEETNGTDEIQPNNVSQVVGVAENSTVSSI